MEETMGIITDEMDVDSTDEMDVDSQEKYEPVCTAGDGACAYHAVFGTWNAVAGELQADNVQDIIKKLRSSLLNLQPDKHQVIFSLLKEEIFQRLVDDQGFTRLFGKNPLDGELANLVKNYNNFLDEKGKNLAAAWTNLHVMVKEHAGCKELLAKLGYEIENMPSATFKTLLENMQSKEEKTADGQLVIESLKRLLPNLAVSLERAKTIATKEFNKLTINNEVIRSYITQRDFLWLTTKEVGILAYVYSITIEVVDTGDHNGLECYNPGQSTSVRIKNLRGFHYEKMVKSSEYPNYQQNIIPEDEVPPVQDSSLPEPHLFTDTHCGVCNCLLMDISLPKENRKPLIALKSNDDDSEKEKYEFHAECLDSLPGNQEILKINNIPFKPKRIELRLRDLKRIEKKINKLTQKASKALTNPTSNMPTEVDPLLESAVNILILFRNNIDSKDPDGIFNKVGASQGYIKFRKTLSTLKVVNDDGELGYFLSESKLNDLKEDFPFLTVNTWGNAKGKVIKQYSINILEVGGVVSAGIIIPIQKMTASYAFNAVIAKSLTFFGRSASPTAVRSAVLLSAGGVGVGVVVGAIALTILATYKARGFSASLEKAMTDFDTYFRTGSNNSNLLQSTKTLLLNELGQGDNGRSRATRLLRWTLIEWDQFALIHLLLGEIAIEEKEKTAYVEFQKAYKDAKDDQLKLLSLLGMIRLLSPHSNGPPPTGTNNQILDTAERKAALTERVKELNSAPFSSVIKEMGDNFVNNLVIEMSFQVQTKKDLETFIRKPSNCLSMLASRELFLLGYYSPDGELLEPLVLFLRGLTFVLMQMHEVPGNAFKGKLEFTIKAYREKHSMFKFESATNWLFALIAFEECWDKCLENKLDSKATYQFIVQDMKDYITNYFKHIIEKKIFKDSSRIEQYYNTKLLKAQEKNVAPFIEMEPIFEKINHFLRRAITSSVLEERLLLLYGTSGVGKTELIKYSSTKAGFECREFPAGNSNDMFVGQLERRVSKFFSEAKKSGKPTCLFLDEIDSICTSRSQLAGSGEFNPHKITTLIEKEIANLKGTQVVVIGTTNDLTRVNLAIRRLADDAIEVPLPNEEVRVRLFELFLKGVQLPINVTIPALARKTEGWSPRQIKIFSEGLSTKAKNTLLDEKDITDYFKRIRVAGKNVWSGITTFLDNVNEVYQEGLFTQPTIKKASDESQVNWLVPPLNEILWTDRKAQKFHQQTFNQGVAGKRPLFLPTDAITAHYANAAYQENGGKILDGWQCLSTLRQGNAYFGAAYWNEDSRMLIISHRGTDPSDPEKLLATLKTDMDGVVHNDIGVEMLTAIRFTFEVMARLQKWGWRYLEEASPGDIQNNRCYGLTQTGHSLGAWLSQIVTIHFALFRHFRFHNVGFEPPGTRAMLEKMCKQANQDAGQLEEQLDITEYFSSLNMVNGCGEHIGHTQYRLYPDWPIKWQESKAAEYSQYLLTAHSMHSVKKDAEGNIIHEGGMLALFNSEEYLQGKRRQRIRAWPKMLWAEKESSSWKVLWLGKKIVDLKTLLFNQSEYWEFFQVANVTNRYEPPELWITQKLQNQYRLGYSKMESPKPLGSYKLALQRLPAYVGNAVLLLKNILDSGKLKIHQSNVVKKFFEDYHSLLDEASRLSIMRWLDSLSYDLVARTVTLMPYASQEGAPLLRDIELKQSFQRLCYALCYGPAASLLPRLQAVSEQVLQDMHEHIKEIRQEGAEQTKMYNDLAEQVEILKTILQAQQSKAKLDQPQASSDSSKSESVNSVVSFFTSPISQPHDQQQRTVVNLPTAEDERMNITEARPTFQR